MLGLGEQLAWDEGVAKTEAWEGFGYVIETGAWVPVSVGGRVAGLVQYDE